MDLEQRLRARACAVQDCARALVGPAWHRLEVLFEPAHDGGLHAVSVVGATGDEEAIAGADASFYLSQAGAAATALRELLSEASVHWSGRALSIEPLHDGVQVAPLPSGGAEPLCAIDIDERFLGGCSVFTPSLARALGDAATTITERMERFAPWREGQPARVDWDAGQIAFAGGPARRQELIGAYLEAQQAFVWSWLADVGGRRVPTPSLDAWRERGELPLVNWTGPFPVGPNVARRIGWLVALQLEAEGLYEGARGGIAYLHAVW